MRVALIALEAPTLDQIAGWLGDEGHLPRRFDSVSMFAASDELGEVAVAICNGEDSAAVAAAITKGSRLVVIGEDGINADATLELPLRRRAVLAALT